MITLTTEAQIKVSSMLKEAGEGFALAILSNQVDVQVLNMACR